MPVPTNDQQAGTRAWFAGVRANVLDVVCPLFAAYNSDPPLTAEVLQDLADAGSAPEFLAMMETDVGVRGIALRALCSYFGTAVAAARAGRPAGGATTTATIHSSMALATLQAVRANAGATDAVLVQAVERVAEQTYVDGAALREQDESNGPYMEAIFRHGPGSAKVGAYKGRGRGGGGGGDDVVLEETSNGGLSIVGKSYLTWGKDLQHFDHQWNAAYDRANADGMLGARDRLLVVQRWLTSIPDWTVRKTIFLRIMEDHHCKLPAQKYDSLLLLQVVQKQGEIDSLLAQGKGADGMDCGKDAGRAKGLPVDSDGGEMLVLLKRAMGPAGAINRLIEEVKGVAWLLKALHDGQLPRGDILKLSDAVLNCSTELRSLHQLNHGPSEMMPTQEVESPSVDPTQKATSPSAAPSPSETQPTEEAAPASTVDSPTIHPISPETKRKKLSQKARARAKNAQGNGAGGR